MPIRVDHIMSAIVALIVLAIGVFVFFTIVNSLPSQPKEISNDVATPSQLFSIIGIVAIVGVAIGILAYVSRLFMYSDIEEFSDESVSSILKHHYPESNQVKEKTVEEIDKEIEKEKKQEQLQMVHERYFKGRTSRVGRAIKYIEEENNVGDKKNDSIVS